MEYFWAFIGLIDFPAHPWTYNIFLGVFPRIESKKQKNRKNTTGKPEEELGLGLDLKSNFTRRTNTGSNGDEEFVQRIEGNEGEGGSGQAQAYVDS